MRILHVVTKGDVGGAQTHVEALAGAQVATGNDVSIATGTDGAAMDRARRAGVDVVLVRSLGWAISPRADARAVAEVRDVIRARRPHIVHGHSSKGGLVARIAARLEGVPVVYTAHGWPFQQGASLSQRTKSWVGEWLGGRLGDAVICLTESEAALARRAHVVRPRAVWVVPNGLPDVPPGRLHRAGAQDDPQLVMVARFAPPKQQLALVAVLATLVDLPWTMVFVGDGPELAATVARSGALLGERVRFLGHRDDVAELLAASDISILWSRYEGMPIALMEAMRAGLCCVASDLPGVRALFGPASAGVVAADGAQLTAELRRLLADSTVREDLGRRARERFSSAFAVEATVRATDAVYETVLERHRRRSAAAEDGRRRPWRRRDRTS